ncbi:hypothetical protein BEWA_030030 [Theileria equi strain WA]|uniref:Uncharacterized protein n=1 Tax=Theileria equi strain WA TaxID=1537102 RepID=L0AYQ5_THEEQ|nr:hypothetical protein BEWA_030030 [Theileria equi strain WA]AFZ80151.1 hypothetical protein BEWA_030030 [Theileria equi strain WA]|eukprot:XP_004829817.1 hypothetical protein BEWA_030030 [Theileria equi strain WA]
MSGDVLYLELKQKCGTNYRCNCKTQPKTIETIRVPNSPTKGFTKCTHRISGGKSFNLKDVKYDSVTNKPSGPIPGVIEVTVYYDSDSKPYIIELHKESKNKEYYVNTKPSNEDYSNDIWTQDYTISTYKDLINILEELSCKFANSVVLDTFKDKSRSNCKSRKVGLKGTFFGADQDFYEFKQHSQHGKSFKVPYLKYNDRELPITFTSKGIQEITSIYWKHNFGRPLVIKVVDEDGDTEYYFNSDGGTWEKKDAKDVKELKNTVVEHNCRRNKVTIIDLSRKNEEYCCTKDCENKRIKVIKSSDAYKGFSIYEHSSKDGFPFNIDKIVSKNEKQKGIKYPIRDVYTVTVYYATPCESEPIFMDIKYAYDELLDNKWYKRITKNGWDDKLSIPDTYAEINEELRNNFKTVATLLTSDCSPNSLPRDGAIPRKEPEPKTFSSPEKVFEDLKIQAISSEFPIPKGPKEQDAEDRQLKGLQSPKKLNELRGNPKTTSITPDKLAPIVKKVLEENIKAKGATPSQLAFLKAVSPGVTIDIKENTDGTDYSKTYNYGGLGDKDVKLTKKEDPPGSGFFKFTHKPQSGVGSFKVEKVNFGKDGKSSPPNQLQFDKGDNIKHLVVWYWGQDSSLNTPLLVEVKKDDGTFIYSANKGPSWQPFNIRPPLIPTIQLQDEPLEKVLDDLNCSLNQAVTMDISYDKNGPYCCDNGHNKVQVSSENITISSKSLVGGGKKFIDYHTHSITNNGAQLAKIKCYERSNHDPRKRISFLGLPFPIQDPISITVFYCQNKPVLIYLPNKSPGKQWFKKPDNSSINSYDEQWKEVNELTGLTPDSANRNCNNWNQVKNILNKFGCNTGTCSNNPGSQFSNSHTGVNFQAQVPPPPEVTIDLSQNQKADENPAEYKYNGKEIKVKRSNEPRGSDFFKYIHILETGGPGFTLKEIQGDDGNPTNGIPMNISVLSVSAYYWQHKTDSALLVEIKIDDGNTKYYRNNRNGKWTLHSIEDSKKGLTKEELDLLNCEINDAVIIDVGKRSNYDACNERDNRPNYKHTNDKILAFKDVDSSKNLLSYQVYTHKLRTIGIFTQRFHITAFKDSHRGNLSGLPTPILDVKEVKVYMCGDRPLLVYIDSKDTEISVRKWYKYESEMKWTWAVYLSSHTPKSSGAYNDVLKVLDGLNSICAPPSVTIDIEKKKGRYRDPNSSRRVMIWIEKTECLSKKGGSPSHYTRYDHQVVGREDSYFTLSGLVYGGSGITLKGGDTPMENVTSVSVYYWHHLPNGRPLLLKIEQAKHKSYPSGPKTVTWYKNTGIDDGNLNWGPTSVDTANIETKLDHQNCKLNNAVVIDVSIRDKTYDACDRKDLDTHSETKMTVSEDASNPSLGGYKVYIHKLKDGSHGQKFHVVGFKNDSSSITLPGIGPTTDRPILDVSEVRVYFCQQEPKKPLLIYYHISNGGSPEHHLYKNTSKGTESNFGEWENAGLLNTDGPEKHKEILDVLNTLDSKCRVATQGTTSKLTEILTIPASIAGYFFAGTAGSAATFFGGWKLYNRYKGDPWVRQI